MLLQQYCIPFTDTCRAMAEWGVFWQAAGVIAAIIFGAYGLLKIYRELAQFKSQKAETINSQAAAARLKRTEFFLSQHRRLFDDKDLFEILCLLDSDDKILAHVNMWDKKRKFLTYLEEISLLIRSDQINEDVAFYMFGYYSICARDGKNFSIGMDMSKKYWALFYDFCNGAEVFLKEHPDGPSTGIKL